MTQRWKLGEKEGKKKNKEEKKVVNTEGLKEKIKRTEGKFEE